MAYTDTWDGTYEGLPADSEAGKLGAGRIRDLKQDVRERLNQIAGVGEPYSTVASAATPDIFASTISGVINYTGVGTATGFVAAPFAGARRVLVCAGACSFTNSGSLACPGGVDFTAAAGDIVHIYAITVSTFRITVLKADGTPVANSSVQNLSFSVYKSATQSITQNTSTKITFNTKSWDTATYWDTSTSKFTPLVAGKYRFSFSGVMTGTNVAANQSDALVLYKNGVAYKQTPDFENITATRACGVAGTITAIANGTTDYFELYWKNSGASGAMTLTNDPTYTYFQGEGI